MAADPPKEALLFGVIRDPMVTSMRLHALLFSARAEHRRMKAYYDYKWETFCKPALKKYGDNGAGARPPDVDLKGIQGTDEEKFTAIRKAKDFQYTSADRHIDDPIFIRFEKGDRKKTMYRLKDFVYTDHGDPPHTPYNVFLEENKPPYGDSDDEKNVNT